MLVKAGLSLASVGRVRKEIGANLGTIIDAFHRVDFIEAWKALVG